jgi:hypothetical protein
MDIPEYCLYIFLGLAILLVAFKLVRNPCVVDIFDKPVRYR